MSIETWADRFQKRYLHRIYKALDGKLGIRWIYTDAEMRAMGYPWGGDPVARWVNWYIEHGGIACGLVGGAFAIVGGFSLFWWAIGTSVGAAFYWAREWFYGALGTRDGLMDAIAPTTYALVLWALWGVL